MLGNPVKGFSVNTLVVGPCEDDSERIANSPMFIATAKGARRGHRLYNWKYNFEYSKYKGIKHKEGKLCKTGEVWRKSWLIKPNR